MLGLANTISSGSTLESLYSITFDGTNDYIDLGDNIDLGTDNFTISLWAKFADATHSGVVSYFLSKNQNEHNRVRLFLSTAGKIQVRIHGEETEIINKTGDTAVTALEDTWVHICISCERDGNMLLYVNGSTSTYGFSHGVSSTSSVNLDNTGSWTVGTLDGTSNYFNGKIDEVSIWGAALDSGSVGKLYDQGSSINVTTGSSIDSTHLKGYWRMGNGTFDDKANGAVHDQHAPGFGSDVVTDGDFPSLDNWDELNEGGDNQVTLVDGKAKLTYVTGSTTDALGIRQSGILTIGNTYKITMDVVVTTGNGVKVWTGAGHAENIGTGAHVSYFVASSANFPIYRQSSNTSTTATVDNIVIKQLNGYPGLTSNVDVPTAFSSDTP